MSHSAARSRHTGTVRFVLFTLLSSTLIVQHSTHALEPAVESTSKLRACDFLPASVSAAAILRNGDRQLDAFRDLLNTHQLLDSSAYAMLARTPGFVQAQVGLRGVAASAGLDAWSAIGAVLGRESAIALQMRRGKPPAFLAVSIPRDADALDRLTDIVLALTGLKQGDEPDAERSSLVEDVRVYRPNAESCFCRLEGALFLANDRDLLSEAIRVRHSNAACLSGEKRYRAAEAMVPADAAAWAYVDTAGIRDTLSGGDNDEKADQGRIPNPLAGFIFGGWWQTIRHSTGAVAWVTAANERLSINARLMDTAPLPETHGGFVWKRPPVSTWSAEKLPGYLSEITIARDWASLFAERETLLTLPAAGDLVNFSNTVTTLMGQLGFADEFLPAVDGPVRFIMTRQDFASRGYKPTPKLPAFALVVPLAIGEDSNLPRRLHSASQMALSFINADAGQKQQPTFLLDVDRYKDVRVVFAEYPRGPSRESSMMARAPSSRPAGDAKYAHSNDADDRGLPTTRTATAVDGSSADAAKTFGIRYNFAPAAAVVENQYVVATSLDLLHAIIDAARSPAAGGKSEAPSGDRASLSGGTLQSILRDNRRELIAQRMLEKDMPRRQARREIEAFLELLGHLRSVDVSSRLTDRGGEATLTISLQRPESGKTP